MAQDATLATRRSKRTLSAEEALDRWEQVARRRGRDLRRLPGRVVGCGHHTAPGGWADPVSAVLRRLETASRSSFSRHDLLRAALDVLPAEPLSSGELQGRAERLVD